MYPEVIFKMFSVRRVNHFWNNIRDCTVFFGSGSAGTGAED